MPRYDQWRVLSGDTDRQDLLDYGKKLLGYLAEQRRLSGVETMAVQRTLPDGSVVRARFLGDTPLIECIAAPRPPPDIPTEPDATGFVVTATTSSLPAGIDATYPQQILKPSWTTFFKNKAIAAYNAFVGKKGTYGTRFSDGVRYAGNIDWRDAEGVRINYYGPTLRYWYDLYRKPTAQYGKWVFLNGAILLDIDAYCTDSEVDFDERLVLGAALVGDKLFVMQADINDFPALNLPTDYPDNRKTWVSLPYPPGDTALRLVRYRIEKNPNPTGSGDRFVVASGSGDTLWTYSGRGWVNPFVFNPDATVCESFAMPDELRWINFNDQDLGTTVDLVTPSPSNEHLTLAIGPTSASETFETLTETATDWRSDSAGEASAVIAADYAEDGTRIEVRARGYYSGTNIGTGLPFFTLGLQFDDGKPLNLRSDDLPVIDPGNLRRSRLLCVDARKKIALTRSYIEGNSGGDTLTDLRLRLVTDGTVTQEVSVPNLDDGAGVGYLSLVTPFQPCGYRLDNQYEVSMTPYFGVRLFTNISPMYLAHGIYAGGSFKSGTGLATGGLSFFAWRPFSHHPESLNTDEVVGYSGGYLGYTPNHLAATPGTGGGGVFVTLNVGYGNGAQDALGHRTPNSMAMDDDGNFLASAAFHLTCISPVTAQTIGKTAMVNMTYSATGAPTLQKLTGVSGNAAPYTVDSPNTNFDARYSPIWLIGKPPHF